MKKVCVFLVSVILILSFPFNAFALQTPLTEKGELILEDYSEIILRPEDVQVSEETIDSYLDLMITDIQAAEADLDGQEMSDEFIRQYSEIYFGVPMETVEEAKTYIRTTMEESNRKSAFMDALRELGQVVSYPEAVYEMAHDYVTDELAFYAYQEELEEDELAILSGYGSAEDYIRIRTDDYVKTSMILNQIMEEQQIPYAEENRDTALEEYMSALGYDTYVSQEEFKKTAGDTWLWIFTEFYYKSDLVYQTLKDRIRIG